MTLVNHEYPRQQPKVVTFIRLTLALIDDRELGIHINEFNYRAKVMVDS